MRLLVATEHSTKSSTKTHESPAVGEASASVKRLANETGQHYFQPYSRLIKNPLNRFLTLKSEWLEATQHLSSIAEIVMHPSYQKIIGMGEVAIPMILDELKKSPQHWFWALSAITMEDPVKPEDRGNLEKMSDAWLKWAKDERYSQ